MGKSAEAPPPPDYAAANREGILTDIKTLPLRRQIEQAAALGQGAVYDGKYYQSVDEAQAVRNARAGQMQLAKQELYYLIHPEARGKYVDDQTFMALTPEEEKKLGEIGDFTGLGDDVLSRKNLEIVLDGADELARRQLKMRQEQGVANVEQTVKELRAADPEGYDARLRIQRSVENDVTRYDPEKGDLGMLLGKARADAATPNADIQNLLGAARAAGPDADLQTLLGRSRTAAGTQDADLQTLLGRARTAAGTPDADLQTLLGRARADYALGSKLDASTAAEVEQAARAAQSARGNLLGLGAAAAETMSLGSAGEERRQQRAQALLGIQQVNAADQDRRNAALLGIQQASAADQDRRNAALFGMQQASVADQDRRNQNLLGLTNAAYGDQQARYQNLLGLDANAYGRKQQGLASASSFLLGNPITNQFGNLAGAQNGALSYQPQQVRQGIGQDAQAGSRMQGFAQQNYSQAMDAYNAQAAKGNPWMNMASGALGTAAGAMTGGLGAGMAMSLLGGTGQQGAQAYYKG